MELNRGKRVKVMILTIIAYIVLIFFLKGEGYAYSDRPKVREMTQLETVEFLLNRYEVLQGESNWFKSNKKEIEELEIQLWDGIGKLEDRELKTNLLEKVREISDRNRGINPKTIIIFLVILSAVGISIVTIKYFISRYEYYYEDDEEHYEDGYEYEDDYETYNN